MRGMAWSKLGVEKVASLKAQSRSAGSLAWSVLVMDESRNAKNEVDEAGCNRAADAPTSCSYA